MKKSSGLIVNIIVFVGLEILFFCLSTFTQTDSELSTNTVRSIQKQPLRVVPRKTCSENMQQIYSRTPMPKCDFNKVAKQYLFLSTLLRAASEHLTTFKMHFPASSLKYSALSLTKKLSVGFNWLIGDSAGNSISIIIYFCHLFFD